MSEDRISEEVKSLVLQILKSQEELKARFQPLIKGQEYAQKALASHQKVIKDLMAELIEVSKNQDVIQKELSETKDYTADVEALKRQFVRFEKLENVFFSRILKEIENDKADDLTTEEAEQFEAFVKSKGNSDLFMVLGYMYQDRKDFEKALSSYHSSAELDKTNVHAICLEGQMLLQIGKHKEALEVFEKTPIPDKCQSRILRYRAYSMAVLDKKEEALKLIENAIQIDDKDALLWALKGRILLDMNRSIDSLGAFEQALELKPNLVVALIDKGLALLDLGDTYAKEAVESLEKAASLDDKDPNIWYNYGVALQRLDKDEEAIKSLTKAIDLGIKSPCAYCMRGVSKNHLNDNTGALEDLNIVDQMGGKEECAHFHLDKATVLAALGRFDEALEESSKVIKTKQDDLKYMVLHASILLSLGKKEESGEIINKLDSIPKAEKMKMRAYDQNAVAWYFFETKEYSKGLEFAEFATSQNTIAPFLDTLACILSGLEQNEASLNVFDRAIKIKKSDGDITWEEYALVLEKLGRKEEAKKIREEHGLKS